MSECVCQTRRQVRRRSRRPSVRPFVRPKSISHVAKPEPNAAQRDLLIALSDGRTDGDAGGRHRAHAHSHLSASVSASASASA